MFFARQDAYAFTALAALAGDQLTVAGFAFQFCRAWAAFGAMFLWCGTWSMVHPPLWHYAWCVPALGLWAASVVRSLRERTFGSGSDPTTFAARPWRAMSDELRYLLLVAAVPLALVLGAFGYLLLQRVRHLGIGSGLGGYYLFFAWPAVGTLAALVFTSPMSTRWRRMLIVALAALVIFEASGLWYSCQVYAGVVAKLGDNKTGQCGPRARTPRGIFVSLVRGRMLPGLAGSSWRFGMAHRIRRYLQRCPKQQCLNHP
jgi:hypothetical protein